ncbi:hypothetical protein NBRC3299_0271 [Acetobacter pasteurianus NBRC 3299]|nr:hypothetical protein BBA71_06285 [Acetobacter pasteurianus]GCD73979.1 hypothetical protein NBRC3299_0271 [Acetobacter pasteurianus NBRC 3299]
MADVGTISKALAYTIAQILYPNGIGAGVSPLTGRRTIVRRGWLNNADYTGACSIKNGIDYVGVTAYSTAYRQIAEPLGWPWREGAISPCTVTLTASGNQATVSIADGATPSGVVGLRVIPDRSGLIPDKTSVAYAVQSDDTPELIAQSLAGLIDGAYTSGATVIVPNAALVEAATAGYGQITRVTRRQEQLFTVSIFTNGGNARDNLGSALDAALSAQSWLPTLDGQNALMLFAGASDVDAMQTSGVYRRDFRFKITFDTLNTQTAAQMMFGVGLAHTVTHVGVALHTFGDVSGNVGAISTDDMATFYKDAAGNLVFAVEQPYAGLMLNQAGDVVLQDAATNLAGQPA